MNQIHIKNILLKLKLKYLLKLKVSFHFSLNILEIALTKWFIDPAYWNLKI
jgi:hypothetical protein